VAARSKVWVCRLSFAGTAGSNPTEGMDVCLSVVIVAYCQVEVSATSRSLVQRNPTECGVSGYDRESLIIRRPWPNGGLLHHGKKNTFLHISMQLYHL
jgi:hypothetical protein